MSQNSAGCWSALGFMSSRCDAVLITPREKIRRKIISEQEDNEVSWAGAV